MQSNPPTMLLSLILLAVVATTAASHPRDLDLASRCQHACFCYPQPQHANPQITVKCRDLAAFPTVYPYRTTLIDLSHNPLHRLTAASLRGKRLQHLATFVCVDCQLEDIEVDAFRGFDKLTIIDLSNNNIFGLTVEHFTGLKSLGVLDLAGNERVDCSALKTALPKVTVNCGEATSAGETNLEMKRLKKRDTDSTLDAPSLKVEASTLPAVLPEEEECISGAWKVVAIIFIVLVCLSCVCGVGKFICRCFGAKKTIAKGPEGNRTVYQLTTTEVDDRFT